MTRAEEPRPRRFDVFCRVVDNYGDAGVCWRLARELSAEHAIDVRLWIDCLATLARFEPRVVVEAESQSVSGVEVRRLQDCVDDGVLPDVVIEGFGCGLPDAYMSAMAHATNEPLWINLEYLSAEPWVDTVHALASPHPKLSLSRYFCFPGFTAQTGGLLREAGLLAQRDDYRRARHAHDGLLRLLLFCYANRALPALFEAWAEGDETIVCRIPEGVATGALDTWLQGDVPRPGESRVRGRLTLDVVPFVTQPDFDRLLWECDVNFVRGEDSFVRAGWAARPFVWQPYPQAEGAHRLKLDAFLVRYGEGLEADRCAVEAFWRAFMDEDDAACVNTWPAFRAALPHLEQHGLRWSAALTQLPELGHGLVEFASRQL